MRSRTRSESVRTFSPSTVASPPLSGSKPVSILMTVVFPLPLGPRNPKISPLATSKLTPFTAVSFPKVRTRLRAEMAGSVPGAPPFVFCGVSLTISTSAFKLHVGRHARQNVARRIVDAHFDAEDLVYTFLPGLHVARKKLGLLIDLLNHACKGLPSGRIHHDIRLVADFYAIDFGFRDVNAYINLITLKQCGYRSVRPDQIAGANIQNLYCC